MANNLNQYIDHTQLAPISTKKDIEQLCQEARLYDFHSVCVASSYVALARKLLEHSSVTVAAVVGFPLGTMSTYGKATEAKKACEDGAQEIDMVLHIGALKEEDYDYVLQDISTVGQVIKPFHATLKVIIETALLTQKEIVTAAQLAVDAGAHYVKTSTGFANDGATVEHVALIQSVVGDKAKIKASGGIRDKETALSMIRAGAHRLGTSASVRIMKNQDFPSKDGK